MFLFFAKNKPAIHKDTRDMIKQTMPATAALGARSKLTRGAMNSDSASRRIPKTPIMMNCVFLNLIFTTPAPPCWRLCDVRIGNTMNSPYRIFFCENL